MIQVSCASTKSYFPINRVRNTTQPEGDDDLTATAEDQDDSHPMPVGTVDHHEVADQPTAEANVRRSKRHRHKPLRLGQNIYDF